MTRRLGSLLLVFTVVAGCGPGFNAASGEDARRGGAVACAVNTLMYDRVSESQGDDTDWKTFELVADANVRIRIWWDDPEVEAMVTLYNQRARMIAEILHEEDVHMDELEPIGLDAGTYFLRIEAEDGASVYSLELDTDDGHSGGSTRSRPGF